MREILRITIRGVFFIFAFFFFYALYYIFYGFNAARVPAKNEFPPFVAPEPIVTYIKTKKITCGRRYRRSKQRDKLFTANRREKN